MGAPSLILTQNRVHKSIRGMTPTTLPPFTVLTGVNGSGKSHLLHGLSVGAITTNVTDNPAQEIGIFDWNSLVPNDTGVVNIAQIHQHRDWFINHVRARKNEMLPKLQQLLTRHHIDNEFASHPWDTLSVTPIELEKLGVPSDSIPTVQGELEKFEKEIKNYVTSKLGDDPVKRSLFDSLSREGEIFNRLSTQAFDKRAFAGYGANLFQQSFGELFFGYFDKQRANDYGEIALKRGQTPSVPPLSPEEFLIKHGEPPWEFVNDTLARAKLDFRIDHPTDPQTTEYHPILTKVSSGDEVQFSSLSSGEKILMSFAFCLYNSTDKRQNVKRPKLLLFDEIDAPLHPSMSRVLVNIIKDVLVEKEGIPVIMVTHASSTVAVSPDDSIHLVTANPTRITQVNKRRAVSVLTADIPTMAIDFSGRRQVLVESDYDADRYQTLFQILAPSLETERSLSFIGVGQANMNNGCAQVIKTVDALAEAGNISVLGLIDWDTTNTPSQRVIVLGHKVRYAIENYLLDPLLIGAALLNINPTHAGLLKLQSTDTYTAFSSLSPEKLQAASSAVQARILAKANASGAAKIVRAKFAGNFELDVDARYHLFNGHDLEGLAKEAFPELKRFHKTGELLYHMADIIIRNHPKLTPQDLVDVMVRLCTSEI